MSAFRHYLNPTESVWGLGLLIASFAIAGGLIAAVAGPIGAAAVVFGLGGYNCRPARNRGRFLGRDPGCGPDTVCHPTYRHRPDSHLSGSGYRRRGHGLAAWTGYRPAEVDHVDTGDITARDLHPDRYVRLHIRSQQRAAYANIVAQIC